MRNQKYTSIEEIEAAYPDPGNETQKERTKRLNTIRQAKSRLIKREQRRLAAEVSQQSQAGSSQVQTQQSQAGSLRCKHAPKQRQTLLPLRFKHVPEQSQEAPHLKHQHGPKQLQAIHYENKNQERH